MNIIPGRFAESTCEPTLARLSALGTLCRFQCSQTLDLFPTPTGNDSQARVLPLWPFGGVSDVSVPGKCAIITFMRSPVPAVSVTQRADILPDLLRPGLDLLICGTAAGRRSASQRAYYAHPGNRFWSILAETGLTPRPLVAEEYGRLLEFGIGLTDLVKRDSGTDARLRAADFDVTRFMDTLRTVRPRVLAFNGKKAASICYGVRTANIDYGRQVAGIGKTVVFVLTQMSGGNAHWRPEPWRECAGFVKAIRSVPEPASSTVGSTSNLSFECASRHALTSLR